MAPAPLKRDNPPPPAPPLGPRPPPPRDSPTHPLHRAPKLTAPFSAFNTDYKKPPAAITGAPPENKTPNVSLLEKKDLTAPDSAVFIYKAYGVKDPDTLPSRRRDPFLERLVERYELYYRSTWNHSRLPKYDTIGNFQIKVIEALTYEPSTSIFCFQS